MWPKGVRPYFDGEQMRPRRMAYIVQVGDPGRQPVKTRCQSARCVNGDHLYVDEVAPVLGPLCPACGRNHYDIEVGDGICVECLASREAVRAYAGLKVYGRGRD